MKTCIEKLSSLTAEEIGNLTAEESRVCLQYFNNLAELSMEIWECFKSFDTDKRDERTLEIIKNHASGIVLQTMKQTVERCAVFFTRPSEINMAPLEYYKARAENYLTYQKHKPRLDLHELLVTEQLEKLHSSTSSFKQAIN